ncbi:MAG TPA: glycoside hydrolase family 52 protein, partial [Acidobacteriota bacterium]|nr:glycoside hydrolase family 52 protein [Acidobacteriota bacterium]
GLATAAEEHPELRQAFDLFDPKFRDHRGLHLLGAESGLFFRVAPGASRTIPLVLGFYHAGPATTGIAARYYYTRLFPDLEAVLRHGLAGHDRYVAVAHARDRELKASGLSSDQQWLLAQATHSYLGSTQLLEHRGRPLWVVNEGEYRMLNTFDLAADHLFFELRWFPWAVRNVLEQFARRYHYVDAWGVSFTHDMGVCDQFTPAGRSSYECDGLQGCFSHMTMEQLVNWVCCAVTYAEHTNDLTWLRRHRALLLACARSLRTRDSARAAQRDGLLKRDSDRCAGGAEITTYDSLDASLGQARNNLYLAGKTLAAWLLLERAFTRLERSQDARAAAASADLLSRTLLAHFETETGYFPAVFEGGNRSRILPAIEGLVFPLFLGDGEALRVRYPDLMKAFESHLTRALQPGLCLTPAGGWQLSSTSTNTWMSKIFLAQHVIRRLFPRALNPLAARGDAEHVRWQQGPAIGRFAFTDQVRTTTGEDIGSRYYPRGVTAILWLDERIPASR